MATLCAHKRARIRLHTRATPASARARVGRETPTLICVFHVAFAFVMTVNVTHT